MGWLWKSKSKEDEIDLNVDPAKIPAEDLKVSDHFPKVAPSCEKVANNFFTCFTEKGAQKHSDLKDDLSEEEFNSEREMGREGLRKCYKEMLFYDKCMKKNVKFVEKLKEDSQFRVQEEYRNKF